MLLFSPQGENGFPLHKKGKLKMANMGKVTKAKINLRIDLHLCRAVEKKYSQQTDNNKAISYVRALEDATRNVVLDADDYRMILAEITSNELKRKGIR